MSYPESATSREVSSQPDCWEQAIGVAATAPGLPEPHERVAIIGCGTSAYLADSYAALRRQAGSPQTDGWTASGFPRDRGYDRVIAISRSGTTTEVLEVLEDLRGRTGRPRLTGITAASSTPIASLVDDLISLDFADERSVVQTRSMTSALALLRASLGEDVASVAATARAVLGRELPAGALEAEQWTFVGTEWTIGLADEAALKLREATQSWAESYSAMEYRHGPIAIAQPGRAVWCFGPAPDGLAEDVTATGATFINDELDPACDLVRVHQLALELAAARGLDPDEPRNLTRSVILKG